MAIPESPLDKMKTDGALHALASLPMELGKLHHNLRAQTVATLAAAIVGAMGRPVSVAETGEIYQDLLYSMYGGDFTGHGSYQEWAKTKDARLKKVHA